MASAYNDFIRQFTDFIKSCGGKCSDYYVGITNDIDRRLFGEHNVAKKLSQWI